MSTIVSSNQSSVLNPYFVVHQNMAKTKKTPKAGVPSQPVSSAVKDLTGTAKFLDNIDAAMETFDDEVTSLSTDQRQLAYDHLAKGYKDAFNKVWDKAHQADIDTIIDSIRDKQLIDLKKLKQLLCNTKDQPKVVEETRPMPALEQILGP